MTDMRLSNQRVFTFRHTVVSGAKWVVVTRRGAGLPVFAPLKPPVAMPKTRTILPIALHEGDVVVKSLSGDHMDSIKSISLDGVDLPCKAGDGEGTVRISIPAAVTKTAGLKVPIITLTDGKAVQDDKLLAFEVTARKADASK